MARSHQQQLAATADAGSGRTDDRLVLSGLPSRQALALARRGELIYRTGPFVVELTTGHGPLIDLLCALYGEAERLPAPQIADFHLSLARPWGARHWLRPQILFSMDGRKPFEPFPLEQALPLLEWGLNWCIAMEAHRFLMLHSAVLERNGRALLLPALPGSGKSTLCTALAHHGWRLLSDEFGLIDPASGKVHPLPKAIPLKNQAISVIRDFLPDVLMGPEFHGTRKGTVAHVKPPAESLRRQTDPAQPAWVVFPRYKSGAATRRQAIAKSEAFTRLANNSFNYAMTGEAGFHTLVDTIRGCDCYEFEYSDLNQALRSFDQLAASP